MHPQAEDAFHQFGTLCTHQARHAQNLALVELEAAMTEAAGVDGGEILHLQNHLVGGDVLEGRIEVGQLAAHHLGDDLFLGHIGHVPLADVLAVPHDGDFVGDHLDLIHLVADVDQGDALALQLIHDAEEGLNLVLGQRGGGLVQDQHLTVGRNRLGDLHHLHLCDAQRAQLGPRIDVQLQLFQKSLGVLVHFGVVHGGDNAVFLGGVAAQPDVFGHGTGRDGLQLLMHHGNATVQCIQGGGDVDLLPFVFDLAFVHLINAEHAFHQGGLAGAVFAHEGHDFAGAELQPGMVQRFYAREGFDHVFHDQTVF